MMSTKLEAVQLDSIRLDADDIEVKTESVEPIDAMASSKSEPMLITITGVGKKTSSRLKKFEIEINIVTGRRSIGVNSEDERVDYHNNGHTDEDESDISCDECEVDDNTVCSEDDRKELADDTECSDYCDSDFHSNIDVNLLMTPVPNNAFLRNRNGNKIKVIIQSPQQSAKQPPVCFNGSNILENTNVATPIVPEENNDSENRLKTILIIMYVVLYLVWIYKYF
ncbi:uncharacterized protein LOC119690150 [Teleopsis dalmanni]|uniref:uncharacterized protein LOC119690150 n=1 Tax=Teleopsis dalmanni TaxID=139649 RepID=UPI0018CE227C|nr:uncharacterized protein LOC119690150 [Teleopsis dalmanni]